ncbi:MAG: hypothetical protein PHC38_02940 [Weeksellaceae bacterium]|nr:hypothetical protein [Weeksellaceae bacterium]
MLKNAFKLGILSTLLFSVIGCSDDDSSRIETETGEISQISNKEITLFYGNGLTGKYVTLLNSSLNFNRLSGTDGVVPMGTDSYEAPDLSNATQLTGSSWYNLNSNTTYYIAEGTTFTGGINMNGSNIKLYILGTLGGANWLDVKNNAKVVIAPTGKISTVGVVVQNSTVDNYGDILSLDFNLNNNGTLNNYGTIADFQMNSNSYLNNYGTASSSKAGINGDIANYSNLTFTKEVALNSQGSIENYCQLVFKEHININNDIINNGYLNFQEGFRINSQGDLTLNGGSLTDVTNGVINLNKAVKNTESAYARFDIINATIGYFNVSPAFIGKIDINTSLTLPVNSIGNHVTLNGDISIVPNECMPQRGSAACNDDLLSFTLVASVQSPEMDGATLSATDVKVNNGQAYVSYHTNDEFYGDAPNGSLRIFNVQSQSNPLLLAQANFNNAEFNGINVDGNTMYAVGGNKAGARLVTSPLTNGLFDTSDLSVFETYKLPSIAAKNSFMYNNLLWLVSGGSNGGFFKLNPADNYSISEQLYADGARAKYVAQNGSHQAFFAVGTNGAYLRIANIDGSNAAEYTYPTLIQNIANGKNVIVLDNEYVYVALSDKGVAKIRISNGELVNHFEPNEYRLTETGPKVFKENGYTNGVAINDCYLYLANGADGVIVLNKNSFQVVGSFTLTESANYIYAKDDLLFVATGRSGLNIIKVD